MDEINGLENVLVPILGPNIIIVSKNIYLLTANGENYGSKMLGIDLKFKRTINGNEEVLKLIAKCPPNILFQNLFRIQKTFKLEINFYAKIVPALKEFESQHGVGDKLNRFAKYYGSRFNLDKDSLQVDDNAILLLENLIPKGYVCLDRHKGFDLEMAKYVLNYLARFHAVPIAMKLIDPLEFEAKVLKFLLKGKHFAKFLNDMLESTMKFIMKEIENNEFSRNYKEKFRKKIIKGIESLEGSFLENCEPYGTLIHTDFWVNNIMFALDSKREVTDIAFIDFQFLQYGNPARDLFFFLYTSVQAHVIDEHNDELIKYYHKCLVNVLKEFNVDIKPFTLDALIKLMKQDSDCEIFHVLFMLQPIFADSAKLKELKDIKNDEDMGTLWCVVDECYKRFQSVTKQFIRNDWI